MRKKRFAEGPADPIEKHMRHEFILVSRLYIIQHMQGPQVKHGYIVRTGRGYSFPELKEAGIDPQVARKSGVPVDAWRQTKHPENVDQLKSIAKTLTPKKEKVNKKKKG